MSSTATHLPPGPRHLFWPEPLRVQMFTKLPYWLNDWIEQRTADMTRQAGMTVRKAEVIRQLVEKSYKYRQEHGAPVETQGLTAPALAQCQARFPQTLASYIADQAQQAGVTDSEVFRRMLTEGYLLYIEEGDQPSAEPATSHVVGLRPQRGTSTLAELERGLQWARQMGAQDESVVVSGGKRGLIEVRWGTDPYLRSADA